MREEIKKLWHATHKQPKKLKKTKTAQKDITSHPQSLTPSQEDTDEIADPINKIGHLKFNDLVYSDLYFHIISKAPQTTSFLLKPVQCASDSVPRATPSTSSSPQSSNNGHIKCYFFRENRYSLWLYSQANAMIEAGTIMQNDQGCTTWPDGTSILHNGRWSRCDRC